MTHAAVFGSVARGEARADSDIDVLVELDDALPMASSRMQGPFGDVVNRRTLKPLLRGNILHDAIDAF
jgi:uncharacterized protein